MGFNSGFKGLKQFYEAINILKFGYKKKSDTSHTTSSTTSGAHQPC